MPSFIDAQVPDTEGDDGAGARPPFTVQHCSVSNTYPASPTKTILTNPKILLEISPSRYGVKSRLNSNRTHGELAKDLIVAPGPERSGATDLTNRLIMSVPITIGVPSCPQVVSIAPHLLLFISQSNCKLLEQQFCSLFGEYGAFSRRSL